MEKLKASWYYVIIVKGIGGIFCMSDSRKDILKKVAQVTGKGENKFKISHPLKFTLSALGILAAVGGIIYAVYRHSNQKYLEEFEDSLDGEDEDEEEDEFLSNDFEEFDEDEESINIENLGEEESAPDLTGSAYEEHYEEEEMTF